MFILLKSITYKVRYITDIKNEKDISILQVFCFYEVDASVRCGTSTWAGGGGSSSLWLVVSESGGSGLDWGSSVDGPGVWVQLICSMTIGGGWERNETGKYNFNLILINFKLN